MFTYLLIVVVLLLHYTALLYLSTQTHNTHHRLETHIKNVMDRYFNIVLIFVHLPPIRTTIVLLYKLIYRENLVL